MAGRKKTGDLGNPIAVRLDKNIDDQVRLIAELSPTVDSDVSSVIRVLVTSFFMQAKFPLQEFDQIALAVNAWRKQYAAGFFDAKNGIEVRVSVPRRKHRQKTGEGGKE